MSSNAKIQRLVDLMATLLAHRFPRTFLEIAKDVPAYAAGTGDSKQHASIKRTFERDKKELKQLGVPLETHGDEGSEEVAYRIQQRDFYLPYLSVTTPRGASKPRKVDRYGYQSLAFLNFAPDELEVIASAAARARQVGDPALAADADSAIRKLAFDLPLDAMGSGDEHLLAARAPADPAVLRLLGAALLQRRRVAFEYRSMASDAVGERSVEPYGLFFLSGHWYLVARDVARDALRNFRVSRIANSAASVERGAKPEYVIPERFHLRDHARARQSWEIGDGDAVRAVVEFAESEAHGAARLGEPVSDAPNAGWVRRAFMIRRQDAFARWLLSHAGAARPVSPEGVVAEFERQRSATRALYAAPATGDGGRP